jgi:SNF2 family DNA or RNA helicase
MQEEVRWTTTPEARERFTQLLTEPASDLAWFALRQKVERLALSPGFDRLIALDHNTIRELPHQIDVAMRVLRAPMRGRAVLADEVGLGKTIEAGLILKELTVRGLARRVLIITPASLVGQWQAELQTKFFEKLHTPMEPHDWKRMSKAIVSYDRARHPKHRAQITKQPWDLVIVDEAHKIKNHKAVSYQMVQEIEKNFLLLLTATPLQNDLRELYNLITLLRPGQLGTWREFRERFLVRGDARRAKDPESLRDLTASVMVRTRRSSVAHDLALPPRKPIHPRIQLTPDEQELYGLTASPRALPGRLPTGRG